MKKRQIVMLPTEKASYISMYYLNQKRENKLNYYKNSEKWDGSINQHLYILSDEEIKEGDWIYDLALNRIIKQPNLNNIDYISLHKKIIATTNPELYWKHTKDQDGDIIGSTGNGICSISQDFIEAYIKAYNEGNIIKEVMVEYIDNGSEEWEGDNENGQPFWNEKIELKLRSGNTIIINRVKEKKYTEEDMKLAHSIGSIFASGKTKITKEERELHFKHWIERLKEDE